MSTKPTKRMAFNFLRSYFDVLNKIEDDKQKLDFVLAIINKQFLDQEPKDLDFLVDLCYESQRHQIEKSVTGWKRAKNTDLTGSPILPLGSSVGSSVVLHPKEEEEEEEEEDKLIITNTTTEVNEDLSFIDRMEMYKDRLGNKNNVIWRENVYRMHKIQKGKLFRVVDQFTVHLGIKYNGIYSENFEKFRTHCSNWVGVQIQNGKLSEFRTVKAIGSI